MRSIQLLVLLLSACSQQPTAPSLQPGTFAGEGRDRLCIAGEAGRLRAGLIAYGTGNSNCSVSGSLEQMGSGWQLVPRGEGDCRIPLIIDGVSVRVGQLPPACSYYCGPGASMNGKSFGRSDASGEAVDLAGDPLC
jgi:hypothetical protein